MHEIGSRVLVDGLEQHHGIEGAITSRINRRRVSVVEGKREGKDASRFVVQLVDGTELKIGRENLRVIQLPEGIDMSEQDEEGETRLHRAVKAALESDSPVANANLDLLLQTKGVYSCQYLHNEDGLMPIHIAACYDDRVDVCELLLRANAPVDQCTLRHDELRNGQWGKKNERGRIEQLAPVDKTPLHIACNMLYEEAREAEKEMLEATQAAKEASSSDATTTKHFGVSCDGCQQDPICGARYRLISVGMQVIYNRYGNILVMATH